MSAARIPGIAHGMGRSYGDVCLNPGGALWATSGLDHFVEFDRLTGRLRCEAGVLLKDIQSLALPAGWMLPVSPGTQFVTVGGAIANDVHGKNHHVQGSFGDHVQQLTLIRTDGRCIECGPDIEPEWFAATVGGLGLTGIIVSVTLQLRRVAGPWLNVETVPYSGLAQFLSLSDQSERDWEYTVSWIDCLSGARPRGIFMRGNHTDIDHVAPNQKAPRSFPITPPFSLVNQFSLKAFNALYFRMQRWKSGVGVAHYQPFFYPLDNLLHWNRMYGRRGFYQYQCAVPRDSGLQAIEDLLSVIGRSGQGSFLAVLKTFGNRRSRGMLSFPMPGLTLALDFPNRGEHTYRLFRELDAVVSAARGRIYMAKDARMSKELFMQGYPQWQAFCSFMDPGMSSMMSRRLLGV
jgi:FAD/FMN-containing dehydrogenase